MADSSIHPFRPQSTACCNKEIVLQVIRQHHWLEVAVLITAAALVILACLAFSQTGTFAQSPHAVFFGFCCLTASGFVLSAELIYKAILCCKLKYQTAAVHLQEGAKIAPSQQPSHEIIFPDTPIKKPFMPRTHTPTEKQ